MTMQPAYYSQSKGQWIPVDEMCPTHRDNALRKIFSSSPKLQQIVWEVLVPDEVVRKALYPYNPLNGLLDYVTETYGEVILQKSDLEDPWYGLLYHQLHG